MKKFYIIILSFFCLAYSPFIECSQEDFQRRAQAAYQKLSAEDQAKIADIQRRHAAGEQLTFDDNDFMQTVEPKLIKIMQEDEEAEIQEAQEQSQKKAQAEKDRAQAEKDKNKNRLAKFESEPLGPCPFDENKDKQFVDLLDNVISLDEEKAARDITHRDLKTTIACDDSVYSLKSIATSPNDSLIAFDGTVISLWWNGKKPFSPKTGPENEFQIQATRSETNPDEYEVMIDGYTVCDNLDLEKQPAHNSLAQKIYQQIGKSQKEDLSTLQSSVEGTRYWGSLTSCSDAKVKMICSKKQLAYLIKKRRTQQATATNQADYKATDMQKLQQEELSKAS